jgi:hypothetical protein
MLGMYHLSHLIAADRQQDLIAAGGGRPRSPFVRLAGVPMWRPAVGALKFRS